MWISRLTAICFSFALTLSQSWADCADSQKLATRAAELKVRGQYLLSSLHYSQAAALACTDQERDHHLYSYALVMISLNEKAEAFDELTKLTSDEFARKVSLVKRLHYDMDSKLTDFDLSRFTAWKDREEPTLAKLNPEHAKLHLHYQSRVQSINGKSPMLAGSLSVVPGLGQVYNGHYQSAAVAFLINAIFYSAYKDFHDHGMHGAANTSLLVFSVTYIGNILNAVKGAKMHNEQLIRPIEQEYYESLFGDL